MVKDCLENPVLASGRHKRVCSSRIYLLVVIKNKNTGFNVIASLLLIY